MENAAQHSPPGTAVDVSGIVERSTGDYLITILDHGTGIEAEQLQVLNSLLQTPSSSTLTISHSIGLQVVSRLADTLGLDVRLDSVEGGGLSSVITVPTKVAAEWSQTAAGRSMGAAAAAAPENSVVASALVAQFTPPPTTPAPEPAAGAPSVVFQDVELPVEPAKPFEQFDPAPATKAPEVFEPIGDPFAEIAGDVAFSEVDTRTLTPTASHVPSPEPEAAEVPAPGPEAAEPFFPQTFAPAPGPAGPR